MAVSAKLTETILLVLEPPPEVEPELEPVPMAPVWIATASRAATLAVNVPPETVKLIVFSFSKETGPYVFQTHEVPVQVLEELVPLMTLQYVPSGSEVVKVADQAESALLIATKPRAPIHSEFIVTPFPLPETVFYSPRPKAIC